jgi:phosphoribosylformylglycinamidine synthase PurS subunit
VKARVHITLKTGVLDPQGKAIAHALASLGFAGVDGVRQGKYIEIDLADTDAAAARSRVEQMCQRLLANTIVEDYKVELTG